MLKKISVLAWAAAATCCCVFVPAAMAQDEPEAVYFAVIETNPPHRVPQEFIIRLTNPERIQQARDIVLGNQTRYIHMGGKIVPERVDYNDLWTFHVEPDSIYFFGRGEEGCDAAMTEVEAHLAEVGGSFLPENKWCPWTTRVVREVKM